jgi:hypothetical protein
MTALAKAEWFQRQLSLESKWMMPVLKDFDAIGPLRLTSCA